MKSDCKKNKTRTSRQALAGFKQMSFLPEPDFNPKFPSKNTLSSRALYMMLNGRKISHPDFETTTSSWRLAAHVLKLKKLGWPVQSIEIKHFALVNPKERHICRYFLPQKVINKIKNGGVV